MEIFLLWIIFSVVIGYVGSKRKIGFFSAFLVSLLLSPIIGLLVTLVSKDIENEKQKEAFNILLQGMQQKQPTPSITTYEDNIRALNKLFNEGAITIDEFQAKKKKLLGL
jgi:Short C-terminal domain